MLSNRFDSSFLLARRNHLHQEPVGFWQTLMCLGLAFLLSTFNIFPIFHLLVPSKDFPILMGIWFLRFMGFPFFLQPFLGTILLLDLEIRELSNRLKDVAASNDLQLTRTFVQEVVGVKSKWARFLQAQLVLGLLQPLAYTFTVLWPLKLLSFCWRKHANISFLVLGGVLKKSPKTDFGPKTLSFSGFFGVGKISSFTG